MHSYAELIAYQRETEALAEVAGRLGWDQETMMPQGAADQRGEEMAAMEKVLHARRSNPAVGAALLALEGTDLTPVQAANLAAIRRGYDRAAKVPADLSATLARETSKAQGIWARARANEDIAAFLPVLERIVALKREEGAALADGRTPYDALLQDYERGASADGIAALFDAMRPRLVALRAAILDRPAPPAISGAYDEAVQMRLTQHIAQAFGYDLSRGRIDKAVHPFSSGSGTDVRITTRTSATDPFGCIYSTIHEVGHAAYEQGIDPEHLLTPLGHGVSMGVHESQSRIYENQLGRSRAFTGWLFGQMTDAFGAAPADTQDAFYAMVNRVSDSFIRTESDEVQYNLHIMLRFDLERALISGDLAVADLEAAWNDRFKTDFGYGVDRPSHGMLQDVHWSVGLFGYFPTYSLGNVYAGCLHKALQADVPDLETALAQGDTAPATAWLRDRVQKYGGLHDPLDLMTRATGTPPAPEPLLDYLETKFSTLYGLS